MDLWIDLNILTFFSLLDTVKVIGTGCILGTPNHRASPWSFPANGIKWVSESLRERRKIYRQDRWLQGTEPRTL